MFSSAKKPDKVDPLVEEDNYEYRPVQWKDFVTKPKYIRGHFPISNEGSRTNSCSVVHRGNRHFSWLGIPYDTP